MILKELTAVAFHTGTQVYKNRELGGREAASSIRAAVNLPRQDTQALLQACSRNPAYISTPSFGLITGITWNVHGTRRSIHMDVKQKGAELSLQPNTCKFTFGAHRKHKILDKLTHTFAYLPWVFIYIFPVLPLSQHRLRQRFWHSSSPAGREGLITRCHLADTFSVDSYLIVQDT